MTDLTVSPSFRNGTYYTLVGTACCACPGGSSIYVFTAVSLRGPWAYRGDAGSNRSQPFDPHSRWNYVTRAQASAVFRVPLAGGGVALVWLGNQWLSGPTRDADLLYWSVLRFGDDGALRQLEYARAATFELGEAVTAAAPSRADLRGP